VCKVRNKEDVIANKMDRCFLVDIMRTYIGTQVDYTSAPEWFESEGDQKKVIDINLISALDQVHFRSQ
jgi:hypothetical protein